MRFLLLLPFLLSCAGGDVSSDIQITHSVTLRNLSQFDLQYAFTHGEDEDYKSAENFLENPLVVNSETVLLRNSGDVFFLTVVRPKSESGPLRAFTMAQPITVKNTDLTIEYLDTYFRIR